MWIFTLFPSLLFFQILLNGLHIAAVIQGIVQAFPFFFAHPVEAFPFNDRFGENTRFVTSIDAGKAETVILPVEDGKGKAQIIADIVKGIIFNEPNFTETMVLDSHDVLLRLVDHVERPLQIMQFVDVVTQLRFDAGSRFVLHKKGIIRF